MTEIVSAADANWEDHPDAGIFNMLEGKEYCRFRDGIKEAGNIIEPVDIVKGPDGSWLLVDGRNRRRVAKELGFPLKVNRLPDGSFSSSRRTCTGITSSPCRSTGSPGISGCLSS